MGKRGEGIPVGVESGIQVYPQQKQGVIWHLIVEA